MKIKKEFTWSILTLLALIAGLSLKLPLEAALNDLSANHLRNDLLAGSLVRLFIIVGSVYFISKKGFLRFNGLDPFSMASLWLLLVPTLMISQIALSEIEIFRQAETPMLLLFGISTTLIGVLEELILRGIILPLLLKNYANRSYSFIKAIILSSLLFGVIHFINLFREPDNFLGILSQVIFAVGIGFYMAALLFRTQNILAPIFIHFLINFSGGAKKLKENINYDMATTEGFGITDLIPVFILAIIFAVIGLYMIKDVNKEEWIYKISFIRI